MSDRKVRTGAVAHPAPIHWASGALSPTVRLDHSPPAEVKNDWSYTATPLIRLHDVYWDNLPCFISIMFNHL
jgi:hypothetical protein